MATQQWGEETSRAVASFNQPSSMQEEGQNGKRQSARERGKEMTQDWVEKETERKKERLREREGGEGKKAISAYSCAGWSIYGNLGWLSENWSSFCFSPFCSACSQNTFISLLSTILNLLFILKSLVWHVHPIWALWKIFSGSKETITDRRTETDRLTLLFRGNETSCPEPIFAIHVICYESPVWGWCVYACMCAHQKNKTW